MRSLNFLNLPNPSSYTITLGLIEMSARDVPAGKAWSARKADNLATNCEHNI
jgi:hypothetical protein